MLLITSLAKETRKQEQGRMYLGQLNELSHFQTANQESKTLT